MDLGLATVIDPTNIRCRVRLLQEGEPIDVRYAARVQEAGVVIRPCHVVVVDRARVPHEIVWRAGTVATVERMDGELATYVDGYRPPVTVRFRDERRFRSNRTRRLPSATRYSLRDRPSKNWRS